jgi:hypothetical protein
MDDVSVIAPILAYKKFFGKKIYDTLPIKDKRLQITFTVKDIIPCRGVGGYSVWCEIIELGYNGEHIINKSTMNLLSSWISKTISTDLEICSIDNRDVIIINKDKFMEKEMISMYEDYHLNYEIIT